MFPEELFLREPVDRPTFPLRVLTGRHAKLILIYVLVKILPFTICNNATEERISYMSVNDIQTQ